jgi:hypothetical protein
MFGLSGHNIPRICSFRDAELCFERAPRSRNTPPDIGYLVRKHDEAKKIVRVGLGDNAGYAIRYHGTDLVTYYRDRVKIHPGVDSQSDRTIFDCVLPPGIACGNHKGFTAFHIRGAAFIAEAPFTLVRDPVANDWKFEEPVKYQEQYAYAVNRKKAKAVSTKIADIQAYARLANIQQLPESSHKFENLVGTVRDCLYCPSELRKLAPYSSWDSFRAALLVVAGCVEKTELPFGQLASRSPWEKHSHWMT